MTFERWLGCQLLNVFQSTLTYTHLKGSMLSKVHEAETQGRDWESTYILGLGGPINIPNTRSHPSTHTQKDQTARDWTPSKTSVVIPKCRELHPWVKFTEAGCCECVRYLLRCAESLDSGLLLYGCAAIYLVISALKKNGMMKALTLLNLLLLVYTM